MTYNDMNREWKELKLELIKLTENLTDDELFHGNVIYTISGGWDYHCLSFFHMLFKLGYVKKYYIPYSTSYRIVKNIPKNLRYKDLIKMSSGIKHKPGGIVSGSIWDLVVTYINNSKVDVFSFNDIANQIKRYKEDHYPILKKYLRILIRLDYIEVIDENNKVYKINKKHISDKLSFKLANELLRDKIYMRKLKIEKIKNRTI